MQSRKFSQFKTLHDRPGAFVIPNAWDAGFAKILSALGYEDNGTFTYSERAVPDSEAAAYMRSKN